MKDATNDVPDNIQPSKFCYVVPIRRKMVNYQSRGHITFKTSHGRHPSCSCLVCFNIFSITLFSN